MEKNSQFLLRKYSRMSGDRKIRLGMSLSKMAREVRKAGRMATGA